ncbi:MAG TPA: DUF2071 domain-containing protein [Thermoanaerobaculia bacterium]|nr:DUF2071 domain-containing protein [Thermoanaerobaculia bacterium]
MMLQSVVRDCLYLNWALPKESLPEPPSPLRYQLHTWQGGSWVFASAVLFYQDSLHLASLPLLRLCYPQLNLRLYVLDDEGAPAVLFRRMLMPAWVAPGVKLMTHQPASRARLDFPRPSLSADGGPWLWRAKRGGMLEVRAWQGSPLVGEGPRIGSWEETVRYIQERTRGYAEGSGTLHRIDARHRPAALWPLRAELGAADLLPRLLPLRGYNGSGWPQLHSAWLCPQIPFAFELGIVPKVAVAPTVPHPAAGRVVSPVLLSETPGEKTGLVLASAA